MPEKTVAELLADLPAERRAVMSSVRKLIKKHLPDGYTETVSSGMICYCIPLSRYPKTHNRQPLWYAALAASKNSYSLHLMPVYWDAKANAKLKQAFAKAGKKINMGQACVRFKKFEDLEPDAVGEVIASTPADTWIKIYETSRNRKRT